MNIYQQLFADQPLEDLLIDCEFPPGSKLDVARARMWEGNATEASLVAAGGQEPWASFIGACARMRAGLSAKHTLLPIAEDANRDSRARLWAWSALRKVGEKPSAVFAGEALGFVIEVPMDGKIDVLAVYADGCIRFLGAAGQLIIREGDPLSDKANKVMLEAQRLLAIPPTARDANAPGPPPDKVRMSSLSATGVHKVEVPWADVESGAPYAPLFDAALRLFEEVTST